MESQHVRNSSERVSDDLDPSLCHSVEVHEGVRKMAPLLHTLIGQIDIQKLVIDDFSHIERSTVYDYNRLPSEEHFISIKAVQVGYIFN